MQVIGETDCRAKWDSGAAKWDSGQVGQRLSGTAAKWDSGQVGHGLSGRCVQVIEKMPNFIDVYKKKLQEKERQCQEMASKARLCGL
jgi:hypothetical protein